MKKDELDVLIKAVGDIDMEKILYRLGALGIRMTYTVNRWNEFATRLEGSTLEERINKINQIAKDNKQYAIEILDNYQIFNNGVLKMIEAIKEYYKTEK